MTKSFTTGFFALAALTAAAIAVPAMAQTVPGPVTVHISYRDLDISRPEGANILKNRIQAAAARVCGGDVDDRELGRLASATKCRAEAMHGAEMQMEAARLARIDGDKTITVAAR